MKKTLLILSLFFALNFFTPPAAGQSNSINPGFVLSLSAENAGDEWIFISKRKNAEMINIDSSESKVFPIVFKGRVDVPELLYLRISGSNALIPVFIENAEIKVFADFNDPSLTKVEGSLVHKELEAYTSGLSSIGSEKESLLKEYRAAEKAKDTKKADEIVLKYETIERAELDYNRNFVLQNKASFVTPYIIRRSMFNSIELEELKSIIATLDKNLAQSEFIIDMNAKIAILEKVAVGQKFTDIVLPGADGQEMKLCSFVGENIVLIDFWASWCGPCRRENPNVVKLYQDYHAKGFDIVGVSLDTDEKGWKTAIESDNLTWHHMSDLQGWKSKAAGLYGVNGIPHTVLLDRDGIIIAKDVRGDELRALVAKLLD